MLRTLLGEIQLQDLNDLGNCLLSSLRNRLILMVDETIRQQDYSIVECFDHRLRQYQILVEFSQSYKNTDL